MFVAIGQIQILEGRFEERYQSWINVESRLVGDAELAAVVASGGMFGRICVLP